jgi:hypothetical protein
MRKLVPVGDLSSGGSVARYVCAWDDGLEHLRRRDMKDRVRREDEDVNTRSSAADATTMKAAAHPADHLPSIQRDGKSPNDEVMELAWRWL